MPNDRHEALRQRYQPAKMRVLFLGESPPVGGTFFYAADSNLQRYTQRAFSQAYQYEWESGEAFLASFQALGCYLDDLCLDPVNQLDPAARRRQRVVAAPLLAARLQRITPHAVVSVMTATRREVTAAIAMSGVQPQFVDFMPFPTFGNQYKYLQRLTETLHKLHTMGILDSAVR